MFFKIASTNDSHGWKLKDKKEDYIVKNHNDNESFPNKREVTQSPRYGTYHDVTIRNYNKQYIYKSNYILNAAKFEKYLTKRKTDLTASLINGHENPNNVLSYKYGLVYPPPYTYALYILKEPHAPQPISHSSQPPFHPCSDTLPFLLYHPYSFSIQKPCNPFLSPRSNTSSFPNKINSSPISTPNL